MMVQLTLTLCISQSGQKAHHAIAPLIAAAQVAPKVCWGMSLLMCWYFSSFDYYCWKNDHKLAPAVGLGITFWTQSVIGPLTWFVMRLLLSTVGINRKHRYATKVGPDHILQFLVAVGDVSPLLNKSAAETTQSMPVLPTINCMRMQPWCFYWHFVSSWHRRSLRNVLLVSIINSCGNADQLTIWLWLLMIPGPPVLYSDTP